MENNFQKGTVVLLTGILLSFAACSNDMNDEYPSSKEIYSESGEAAPVSPEEGTMDELPSKNERGYESEINVVENSTQKKDNTGISIMSAPPEYFSSIAAIESEEKFPGKKFIRTAEMRFRVENVMRSSFEIEDAIARLNGYVSYTNMHSVVESKSTRKISDDSSLVITKYSLQNEIRIRVPNTKLDSALKQIARHIEFLDHRIVTAEDVSLKLLSEKLAMARLPRYNERMSKAVDLKGKNLESIESAEGAILQKEKEKDEAFLTELRTQDQINYSTISLNIYEETKTISSLIANEKSMEEYEPGFWSRMGDSLKAGWNAVEEILIVLARIWFFLLIAGIVAIYTVRWIKKK